MEKGGLIKFALIAGALLVGLVAIGMAIRSVGGFGIPEPQSIASAALESVKEQKRLSAFAANYVVAVTSEQERLGLSASKTMIVEGLVRYEINLDELKPEDVRWATNSNRLFIRLPSIKLAGPQINLQKIREYDDGGLLRLITRADEALDKANRKKAEEELLQQAQAALPMKLARDAHRQAIQQLFEMPLRAVDLTTRVEVFYADEEKADGDWDKALPL